MVTHSCVKHVERVLVVINNYHGYWEYGVSAFLPWNTAMAVARRTAENMLNYGDMGLGTWQAAHKRKQVWNIPTGSGDRFEGDYYPNLWTGSLSNIDVHGNNRALRYRDRTKFVFATTDGTAEHMPMYWEPSADVLREMLGGK
jgi:hypothetical protein